MDTTDFVSNLLVGVILIGYPAMFLILFASPFWTIKYLLKRPFTTPNVLAGIAIGMTLDYAWFKLGMWAFLQLGGLAFCGIYGC
ncbi:MAG: hypothetical protein ABIH36_04325 [bacterium]